MKLVRNFVLFLFLFCESVLLHNNYVSGRCNVQSGIKIFVCDYFAMNGYNKSKDNLIKYVSAERDDEDTYYCMYAYSLLFL